MKSLLIAAVAALSIGSARAEITCGDLSTWLKQDMVDANVALTAAYVSMANAKGDSPDGFCANGTAVPATSQNAQPFVQKIIAWCADGSPNKSLRGTMFLIATLELPHGYCAGR